MLLKQKKQKNGGEQQNRRNGGKRRAEETADNLRGQLRSYLEDMNKLRAELDELRRARG